MLQAIRDHLTGWVSILLFIVIGLAFALWGVPNEFTSRNTVAEVNGEEIPLQDINRAYRNQLNQFQQFSEVSPETEDLIRNQVLQGLVIDEVLSQHTTKTGYRIGDGALQTHVRNMEAFQDQGQFSIDLFRSRLSIQGISPQYFEAQMRRGLRISQLRRGIAETAFVTPQEQEQRTRLERQQRLAEWIQVSVDLESDQIEVSPEDIQAHHEANSELYMQPENVDIAYIKLDLADLAAEADITDADLREHYQREADSGRFQEPEERQARHILIAVDADTDDAAASSMAVQTLERLKGGEDFAAVAAEISDDPGSGPEGGDLGWAQRSAYVGAFADALFSMEIDEIRGPVRTEFGYHVIRMDGTRGGVPKSFAEVSAELQSELGRIRAEDRFYELSEQVSDLGFENPDTLDPIVSDLGLEVTTLSGVTHDGGTGIAANPLIIDAAFSERVLDQRENSDLIELSSDSRIILRVEDYRAAELHPLAEVSDSIAALLKLEAAEQLAAEQGEALLARAQSGESLESLAAESGAEYHAAESYRRTAALPLVLRDALFVAPQPTPEQVTYRGVALDDGSFALFALTDVVPGSTDNLGAPDAIANQSGIGDLSAYVSQLRDDASVVLRPELLQ